MIKNKDALQKFLFENVPVRGELVRLEHSYQQIADQHAYPAAMRELLGQGLVVVNLLGAIIKFKGRLTLQFQGKDSVKLLLVQTDHELRFRGLIQYSDNIDQDKLMAELKKGTLAITIDPQIPGQRYQGIVNWQGKSLAQSIEGYFRDSEQLPTRLWIAVNQTTAVGLLLQIMPTHSHDDEEDEGWEHLVHLTDTITSDELLKCTNGEILHRLYHQEDIRLFDPIDVGFQCTCSNEKSENAILMLGIDEAEKELKDKQMIVVTCEFCNNQYKYDRDQVYRIFHK